LLSPVVLPSLFDTLVLSPPGVTLLVPGSFAPHQDIPTLVIPGLSSTLSSFCITY